MTRFVAFALVLLAAGPAAAQYRGRLLPGQSVGVNQPVLSDNGRFELIVQPDGNLVQYNRTTRQARWQSNTLGQAAAALTMQPDGNLVLYDRFRRPLWNTGTRTPGAWFAVQDDGNLVVYTRRRAAWSAR